MTGRGILQLCGTCGLTAALAAPANAQTPQPAPPEPVLTAPRAVATPGRDLSKDPPPAIPAALPVVQPIDLAAALRLGGVQNPDILIAQQRVVEAVAIRQLAAAQILPSLNAGLNFDAHNGPVQQSSGNILKVNRSSLYLGAGADAVAAGTVNIPGVGYNINLSAALYGFLGTRQLVERSRFASLAVQNQMLREIAVAYAELLRAEGRRSLALQIRGETQEIVRLTANFARTGQGSQADADRAATELRSRDMDLLEAEARVRTASARLVELLNLEPEIRLHPVEDKLVPTPVVPDPLPLCQLLAIALLQRPEIGEWRAAVRQALLALDSAKLLPFSPTIFLGFSSGTTGGGSNLVALAGAPRFGTFGPRNDFDVLAYWTLQNLGLGNRALIRAANSRLSQAESERLVVLNRIREEVASAYVQTHVRFTQIGINEEAARVGVRAFDEDVRRITGGVGRPIALLESLRLAAQARYDYLDSIVAYNEAQMSLYVALGQPPPDMLARPVPTNFATPNVRPLEKQ